MKIESCEKFDLKEVVKCHKEAFPYSLTTLLGSKYLIKNYEWYLENKDAFLLIIKSNDSSQVTGFAGGLLIHESSSHGSSSSVIQYTFRTTISALIIRPYLIFHPNMLLNYSLILRNVYLKVINKFLPKSNEQANFKNINRSLGLVVIGTNKESRGKGIGSSLLVKFEEMGKKMKVDEMHLSVNKNNIAAIKAYKKNGWYVKNTHKNNFVMSKNI
jgi:ribosomal protein S18 acetylase RimI-like enzyme